jgi:hypothetical protein
VWCVWCVCVEGGGVSLSMDECLVVVCELFDGPSPLHPSAL